MSLLTTLPTPLYAATAFDDFVASPDFRVGTAKAMAWLSQIAYETEVPDKIEAILSRWDLRLLDVVSAEIKTVLPIACTHAFVAAGRGAVFVAFAGTDPLCLANWITDFDCHLASTGAAQGFVDAAEMVREQLDGLVAQRPERSLFVTGHSLGGALAVVTALGAFRRPDAVYTFGSPRPGGRGFARDYDGAQLGTSTYRLVYGEDIVPTVAPAQFGFCHVGRYLPCVQGGIFDQAALAGSTGSKDPDFVDGEARKIRAFFAAPLSAAGATAARLRSSVDHVFSGRPLPGARTDPAGILIGLLPPPLRDHAMHRYCSAFP
jgi:triacylglycerol lipase